MSEHTGEDVVIVARVRFALSDGTAEAWLVPMRLADDALAYVAAVYPPDGAIMMGVESTKRDRTALQQIVVARADVTTL